MKKALAEDQVGNESGTSKVLLAAVIIMGVLIIAGVIGLVGVIVHRVMHSGSTVHTATTWNGGLSRLALPLGEGEHIVNVTSRPDGMLAVTLSQAHSERILLWQPEAGRVVSELDFGSTFNPSR